MEGQIFQGWTIKECIGEGSFGKVYRVVKEEFGHIYESALKVLDVPQSQSEVDYFRKEGMSQEEIKAFYYDAVKSIVEEFTLMAKFKGNSNIVSYEDHYIEEKTDEFGWRIYIRMEYLTGVYSHLNEVGYNETEIIKLGIDICKALELCSKANVIHRDIKPENIFVSSNGDYKLGDFGIARQIEKTTGGLSMAGSKSYMAPEIYRGEAYNSTVDIYSLGIVLYRFMNGNRLPFMPPAPEPIKYSDKEKATSKRLLGEAMTNPGNASVAFSSVILKACSYNSRDRYTSATEMRVALEAVLSGENGIPYIANPVISTSKETNEESREAAEETKTVIETNNIFESDGEGTVLIFNKPAQFVQEKKEEEIVFEEVVEEEVEEHIPKKRFPKFLIPIFIVGTLLLAGVGFLGFYIIRFIFSVL